MIEELDYTLTENIVCPYCGYVYCDSFDYFQSRDDDDFDCDNCEKTFHATQFVDVRYSSSKKEESDE